MKEVKEVAALVFLTELLAVGLTFLVQASANSYDKYTDTIERAPLWSWKTFLIVNIVFIVSHLLIRTIVWAVKTLDSEENSEK